MRGDRRDDRAEQAPGGSGEGVVTGGKQRGGRRPLDICLYRVVLGGVARCDDDGARVRACHSRDPARGPVATEGCSELVGASRPVAAVAATARLGPTASGPIGQIGMYTTIIPA